MSAAVNTINARKRAQSWRREKRGEKRGPRFSKAGAEDENSIKEKVRTSTVCVH